MSGPAPIDFGTRASAPIAPLKPAGVGVAPVTLSGQPGVAFLRPITISEASEMGRTQIAAASGIADKITSIARAGDIDEVGKALNGLLVVAKDYDPSSFKKGGGFLGLFKRKVQELKNHFATVDQQVDKLTSEADARISLFKGRIGDLEKLYDDNERRHRELGEVMVVVEQRIEWMRANPPEVDPTDTFSAQRLADWNAVIDYAAKRCDDLRRAQLLCEQQGPQIRLMAANSAALVQKFGAIKSTTIPVLKNAFALYILNLEQEKGAAFADKIDDLTNETLLANSKKLGTTTVAVQKSLARSSIDFSTLQQTQADLLKALDDVQQIRSEMQTRLATERPQLEALSQHLAQRLAS